MLSILLVLILIWYFYIGYSHGIISQTYYLIASIVSLVVTSQFYQTLAEKIMLWIPYSNASQGTMANFFMDADILDPDQVYYAGIAFTVIHVVVYLPFHFTGILVHLVSINYFDNAKTSRVSGALTISAALIFFSPVSTILVTVPTTTVQNILSGSSFMRVIVNDLLPSSNIIKALWVTAILG